MSTLAGTLDPPAAAAAAAPPDPRVPAFAVGDFVWGKIKHHPWWPGRVYDPSHASDRARSAHRKDHSLLVAYFGDDSFAWCDPSQLKPFTAADFPDMAHQNAAKTGLAAAVGDALNAIARRLQRELTCPCIAPAEPELNGTCPVSNYAPTEFLERLRDAARDALSVDMLEATMICSWGLAFAKGSFSDGTFAYRPCREAADLVGNDIDFVALNLDLFGEEVDGDVPCSTGSGNVKTPEEKLYRSRKKRSMGKFTEEGEEAVESRSGMTEEETGSGMGRRERKKSKYLSPPYTLTSGSTAFSGSSKGPELKSPKKEIGVSWPLHLESPKRLGFSSNVLQEEEEDKKSPVLKIYSNPATEILSEFLSTAINPLHLKGNRSAKTVIGFFAAYRSSLYSSGLDFDAYKNKKHLSFCGSVGGKSANIVTVDSDEDESVDGMKSRANEEILSDLGHNTTDGSGQLKTGLKRKARNEISDGISPFDFGQDATNHSVQGKTKSKRKIRKDGAAEGTPFGVLPDATMGSVTHASYDGKTGLKGKVRKYSNKGEGLLDWDLQITNGRVGRKTPYTKKNSKDKMRQKMLKGNKLGRKRGKDGPSGKSLVDMRCGVTNVLEAGKSGRGRKRKDVTTYKGPAVLVLTFAPGVTLPSKEHLISTFGQYGDLIEAETELNNEHGSARIVFSKSSDAKKALNSRNRSTAFGSPVPSYRLCHVPGNKTSPPQTTIPKPPLRYARKSLERIISTLTGSSSPEKDAGSTDGLMPDMKENLIGDMRGLLKKVNRMLSASAAGVS